MCRTYVSDWGSSDQGKKRESISLDPQVHLDIQQNSSALAILFLIGTREKEKKKETLSFPRPTVGTLIDSHRHNKGCHLI